MTTKDGTVGRYLHWILVAFSLGAGVIHFAYAGEHFDVGWLHGTFFAVVAWFQLGWAFVLMVRSSRAVLALGPIVNALVIGTWIMSRVWGVPIGPGAWDPEPISLADGLATGLEVGVVAISLAVLARPALAQQSVRPSVGMAGIGLSSLAVAVVSTLAIAPAFASEHDHGGEGEASGHSHSDEATADQAGHDMAGGTDPPGGEQGEGHTNVVISADGTSACEQSGYGNEGNAGHGHRGPVQVTPLDAKTRATLAAQVAPEKE